MHARAAAGLGLAVAGLVAVAATALACVPLATLQLSAATGRPGDQVRISGSAYQVRNDGTLPVVLRWNTVEGRVLARVVPDASGNIAATITIPEAGPGRYVVLAVQRDERGLHSYGTPSRADFEVLRSPPPSPVGVRVPVPVPVRATGPPIKAAEPIEFVGGVAAVLVAVVGGACAAVWLRRCSIV